MKTGIIILALSLTGCYMQRPGRWDVHLNQGFVESETMYGNFQNINYTNVLVVGSCGGITWKFTTLSGETYRVTGYPQMRRVIEMEKTK